MCRCIEHCTTEESTYILLESGLYICLLNTIISPLKNKLNKGCKVKLIKLLGKIYLKRHFKYTNLIENYNDVGDHIKQGFHIQKSMCEAKNLRDKSGACETKFFVNTEQ